MVFVNNYKWFFHAPISFCHVNQLLKITAFGFIQFAQTKKKPELISSGKTQNTIIHPTRSHEGQFSQSDKSNSSSSPQLGQLSSPLSAVSLSTQNSSPQLGHTTE